METLENYYINGTNYVDYEKINTITSLKLVMKLKRESTNRQYFEFAAAFRDREREMQSEEYLKMLKREEREKKLKRIYK